MQVCAVTAQVRFEYEAETLQQAREMFEAELEEMQAGDALQMLRDCDVEIRSLIGRTPRQMREAEDRECYTCAWVDERFDGPHCSACDNENCGWEPPDRGRSCWTCRYSKELGTRDRCAPCGWGTYTNWEPCEVQDSMRRKEVQDDTEHTC